MCLSPTLLWSMQHFRCCYKSSPLQAHWGRWRHSCLLWPARECPSPTLWSYVFFFFSAACLLFSLLFTFFSWVGVSLSTGYADWPRAVCGSTMCGLAHLVVCFSQTNRRWCLATWEPFWFLCLMWSEDAMRGWECGGVLVLPFLDGFSCKVYLQRLSKILL
jgi:hypothetical protein